MRPKRITAPTQKPVTLAEAKEQIRVYDGNEDAKIQSFIDQAVEYLDGFGGVLGRCICTQVWALPFEGWEKCLNLKLHGIEDVVVKYFDENDMEQTLAPENYVLANYFLGDAVWLKPGISEPRLSENHPFPVTVEVTAGTAAANVPAPLKEMVLDLVGHYDWVREAATDKTMHPVPYGFGAKLASLKRTSI